MWCGRPRPPNTSYLLSSLAGEGARTTSEQQTDFFKASDARPTSAYSVHRPFYDFPRRLLRQGIWRSSHLLEMALYINTMITKNLYVYVSLDPDSDATAYRRPQGHINPQELLKGFSIDDRGLRVATETMNKKTPITGKTGNQVAVMYGYSTGLTRDGYDLFKPDSVFISAGTINFLSVDDVYRFFQEELTRIKRDYKH